jgi:hypothetical protein
VHRVADFLVGAPEQAPIDREPSRCVALLGGVAEQIWVIVLERTVLDAAVAGQEFEMATHCRSDFAQRIEVAVDVERVQRDAIRPAIFPVLRTSHVVDGGEHAHPNLEPRVAA